MNSLILVCVALVQFARASQIHHYMTPDEVMGVFHTTHDRVPPYEVVPVVHTKAEENTAETTHLAFSAFDKEVKLYLNPTEGYLASDRTPVWTVRSNPRAPEGLRFIKHPNALVNIGVFLQDIKRGAALLMNLHGNNRASFDGSLPSDMVIRSLPHRVVRDVMYGEKGLYEPHYEKNATEDGNLVYTYHHVVYKNPPPDGKQYQDFKIIDPPGPKRQVPDVIYPEILIFVDYNEYRLLGRNLEQAKRYIVSFWNGVDLRYRLLTVPRIRLNIAGIVIALDAGAMPFLEKSRVDLAMVDADKALRGMADYLYRESRFPWDFYDIAITMTQLDLCNMMYDDCDPGTLGYAYVAGACDRNHTKRSSEASGIVEDNGGYSGIIPAAHELGHLIGARHDGNEIHADECSPYGGFIMTSGLLLEENGFEWSNCSINSFYKFLNEDRARCLYDEPPRARQIKRYLPGKLLTLDEQCQKVYGTKACNKDSPTVCIRLECELPRTNGLCKATAPAAEGSPCGKNKFCLNGKCVLEGEATKDQNGVNIRFLSMFKKQRITDWFTRPWA